MSHFTKIKTNITDLTALREALSSMGLTLKDRAECRYYSGSPIKENVCKLPGRYDVAFTKNPNENFYYIDADFYTGDVERTIGKQGSTVMKRYAIEKLRIESRKHGYDFIENKSGQIKIYDPTDSSGGYLECNFDRDGNLSIKAQGFEGTSCMRFQNLEEALGNVSREFTGEYYQSISPQFLNEQY